MEVTYHSDDADKDDDGNDDVRGVSVSADVRVSCLVDPQHQQHRNHVHERRICNTHTHRHQPQQQLAAIFISFILLFYANFICS